MRLFLARDVHATAVDGDLVLLDLATDAYFCLADGVRLLKGDGEGFAVDDPAAAEQLLAAGLLAEHPAPRRRYLMPPATRALDLGQDERGSGVWMLTALKSNLKASRAVRRQDLVSLVSQARTEFTDCLREPPAQALMQEVAAFRRLAPWLPHGGVCLMRSYQLLTYLRARGHDAAWVFGVRTWPFGAHCWLQAGDMVLDDTIEHVQAYRPILVA